MDGWYSLNDDGEGTNTPKEMDASARAIIERLIKSCLENMMQLQDITLEITRDEFIVLQRQYDMPDYPKKTLLGYPFTIIPDTKEHA